jgi:hypothetical protein
LGNLPNSTLKEPPAASQGTAKGGHSPAFRIRQYVSSGAHSARIKVCGKIIRAGIAVWPQSMAGRLARFLVNLRREI